MRPRVCGSFDERKTFGHFTLNQQNKCQEDNIIEEAAEEEIGADEAVAATAVADEEITQAIQTSEIKLPSRSYY
jgi:hypothetical protein